VYYQQKHYINEFNFFILIYKFEYFNKGLNRLLYTKKSKVDEEDLVLMETQTLQEKCGKCNGNLILKIYWSKEGYQQKIECSDCDLSAWKRQKK